MSRNEYLREIVKGELDAAHIREMLADGWKPRAVEWEREAPAASEGAPRVEDVPYGLQIARGLRASRRESGRDEDPLHDDGARRSGSLALAHGRGVKSARLRDARRQALDRARGVQHFPAPSGRDAAHFLERELEIATQRDSARGLEFLTGQGR